ncbi:MAG: RNA polymerase sigma factor [Nannocystaceae bacterium]
MTPEQESDVSLLAEWQRGDKAAGDRLFVRHFHAVDRFFANKTAAGEVQDLVQRTFMVAVERAHTFAGRASFRAFILGIANNILREHYRARVKGRHDDVDDHAIADLCAGPSSMVGAKEEQRLLLAALRSLPLESQVILELYFWEDLSGAQLAEVLGIPENTAWTRLRRARLRVGEALERLASSRALLESTRDGLEGWARSLRGASA